MQKKNLSCTLSDTNQQPGPVAEVAKRLQHQDQGSDSH